MEYIKWTLQAKQATKTTSSKFQHPFCIYLHISATVQDTATHYCMVMHSATQTLQVNFAFLSTGIQDTDANILTRSSAIAVGPHVEILSTAAQLH